MTATRLRPDDRRGAGAPRDGASAVPGRARIGRPAVSRRGSSRRTVRIALSAFGSSRQIDCHVPSAEPAADDRHGQRRRREQRQDVVGAVAGRAVAVAVQPLVARQQPIERGQQVVVRARPDLDDDEPGRGVRARRPTAGRRRRRPPRTRTRRRPRSGRTSPRTDPGPDRQLAACLREDAPEGVAQPAEAAAGRRRLVARRLARRRGCRRPTGAARRRCCSPG